MTDLLINNFNQKYPEYKHLDKIVKLLLCNFVNDVSLITQDIFTIAICHLPIDINILEQLYNSGFTFTKDQADIIAGNGFLDMLIKLHEWNIDCTNVGSMYACIGNHFDVVKKLYEWKIPFDIHCANNSAMQGNTKMLKLLHFYNINCTSLGADYAATGNHIETLKYLHSLNINCSRKYLDKAAIRGHFDIIQKLYKWKMITCENILLAIEYKPFNINLFFPIIKKGVVIDDLKIIKNKEVRDDLYKLVYN